MSGRRLLSVLVGLMLIPAFLTSLAQARARSTTTIRLLSVAGAYRYKDAAPKGLSAGDSVTGTDRLYDLAAQLGRRKGALVGSDSGTWKILSAKGAAAFRGVARLPGGTIFVKGRIALDASSGSLPVVGGSGRFAGARGTLVVRELGTQGRAANIFLLTLP
jgi:hypothetical protein